MAAIDTNATGGAPTSGASAGAADRSGSFFESLARAWGGTLDKQTERIAGIADEIAAGNESPSTLAMLTAESLRMSYMANSTATSVDSVGQALGTVARKG